MDNEKDKLLTTCLFFVTIYSVTLLNKALLKKIFGRLDHKLPTSLRIVVGGAGALILAYKYELGTRDIDAIPVKSALSMAEIERYAREVAREFSLDYDWLNPYFQSFAHVLPRSYGERLIPVYKGKFLEVFALGPEDLLILKCFAHREKDIGHARLLMKTCKNLSFVDDHLQKMLEENVPNAQEACDFFDDIKSGLGI